MQKEGVPKNIKKNLVRSILLLMRWLNSDDQKWQQTSTSIQDLLMAWIYNTYSYMNELKIPAKYMKQNS